MANIITKSDFITTIKIANKSDMSVNEDLTNFITEYEPKFLNELFGDDFAASFIAGIAAATPRFTNLLTPQLRKAIATYIYYHYQRDNYEQSTGVGVVKTANQNATLTTPRNKMIATWFEMVKECFAVQKILSDDGGVIYPEWVVPYWYPLLWTCWGAYGLDYAINGFQRNCGIPDIYYPLSRL